MCVCLSGAGRCVYNATQRFSLHYILSKYVLWQTLPETKYSLRVAVLSCSFLIFQMQVFFFLSLPLVLLPAIKILLSFRSCFPAGLGQQEHPASRFAQLGIAQSESFSCRAGSMIQRGRRQRVTEREKLKAVKGWSGFQNAAWEVSKWYG